MQVGLEPNPSTQPWGVLDRAAGAQGWAMRPGGMLPHRRHPWVQRRRLAGGVSSLVPPAVPLPLWGNRFGGGSAGVAQVVWEARVAPGQLLTVPSAQSRPSCGLGTNCLTCDCLMAKARPTHGVYFSLNWQGGGWGEGEA